MSCSLTLKNGFRLLNSVVLDGTFFMPAEPLMESMLPVSTQRSVVRTYYNWNGFYAIVLMVLVDADYKFIWKAMDQHLHRDIHQFSIEENP